MKQQLKKKRFHLRPITTRPAMMFAFSRAQLFSTQALLIASMENLTRFNQRIYIFRT